MQRGRWTTLPPPGRLSGRALQVGGLLYALFMVTLPPEPHTGAAVAHTRSWVLSHTFHLLSGVLLPIGIAGWYVRLRGGTPWWVFALFLTAFVGAVTFAGTGMITAIVWPAVAAAAPHVVEADGQWWGPPIYPLLIAPQALLVVGVGLLALPTIRDGGLSRWGPWLVVAGAVLQVVRAVSSGLSPVAGAELPLQVFVAGAVLWGAGLSWLGSNLCAGPVRPTGGQYRPPGGAPTTQGHTRRRYERPSRAALTRRPDPDQIADTGRRHRGPAAGAVPPQPGGTGDAPQTGGNDGRAQALAVLTPIRADWVPLGLGPLRLPLPRSWASACWTGVLRLLFRAAGADKPGVRKYARLSFIHFAHWGIVEGSFFNARSTQPAVVKHNYLLFMSNYNGPFEQYVDGFVHVFAGKHFRMFGERLLEDSVTLIWRHCYGFRGTLPAEAFKDYIDRNALATSYYWSAYPQASTTMVLAALELDGRLAEFERRHRETTPAHADAFRRDFLRFLIAIQEHL